jgi:DNA primase
LGRDKVPHSLIEDVLSKLDIVDVISSYITLKPSGRNFIALCPFHAEKTPSFVVSPEKQIFKCFGCGVGGNVITFLEKYENLSFKEALKRAAQLAGIELSRDIYEDERTSELEEAAYKAALFFNAQIESVNEYLESRGINRELANKFLLGFAPSGYTKEIGIKEETQRKLNLISSSGKEFFSGRLIIPIFNHSGKVVAFGARALKENQQPKYINSPESEIFKKSFILFGFNQSRDEILKRREIIIVEGYFDVISLYGCGIRNVVAPMGTSLTKEQAKTARRYADKVILMFDGDSAGRKATLRASSIFSEIGIETWVVSLPQGEDPDSLARKNRKELLNQIEQALPLSEWLIREAKVWEILRYMEEGEIYGMNSFEQALVRLVKEGVIDAETALEFSDRKEDLKMKLEE